MTEEEQFFEQLLEKTKQKFLESPVYKKQQGLDEQWSYSVCGAPIKKENGILLGINWGVDPKYKHEPQKYKDIPSKKEFINYRFIKQSKERLKTYLKLDLDNDNTDINYTNLCFFRTPNIDYLKFEDYTNSLELLKEFVDFVNPPWIFSLGIKNYEKLKEFGKLIDDKNYFDNDAKHKGVTAKLWNIDFYCVPHPNAQVTDDERNKIWQQIGEQFAFSHLNKNISIL